MFRDSVRAFLRDRYHFDARRATIAGQRGHSPAVWQAFAAELGLCGLGFDSALGGLGGDAFDLLAVMEPMGEFAVVEPFIETVVLAGRLLRSAGGAEAGALARRIVAGTAIVACALGEAGTTVDYSAVETRIVADADGHLLCGHKAVVSGAPWASDYLVSARTGEGALVLAHVPAGTPGVRLRPCRTVDGRRAADMQFERCRLPAAAVLLVSDAEDVIAAAVDTATLAICAEAVGLLGAQLRETVAYTRTRHQFGQPLSAFQSLQHRMADMKIALDKAAAATWAAAAHIEGRAAVRAASVSVAKIAVGRACRTVGQGAVQLHGGMGMTTELPIGQRFQRATVIERLYGNIEDHLLRFAAIRDHGLIQASEGTVCVD